MIPTWIVIVGADTHVVVDRRHSVGLALAVSGWYFACVDVVVVETASSLGQHHGAE